MCLLYISIYITIYPSIYLSIYINVYKVSPRSHNKVHTIYTLLPKEIGKQKRERRNKKQAHSLYFELIQSIKSIVFKEWLSTCNLTHSKKAFIKESLIVCSKVANLQRPFYSFPATTSITNTMKWPAKPFFILHPRKFNASLVEFLLLLNRSPRPHQTKTKSTAIEYLL